MCVEAGRPLILTDLETIYGNYSICYHRDSNNQVNKNFFFYFNRESLRFMGSKLYCGGK